MNLRALAWPALIVSMLGANMAIVAVTVIASRRDEGATITPGYDERALRWDEHREALEASRALGWRCEAAVDRTADGAATLQLDLLDASGSPLASMPLQVECFHNAHPKHPTAARLTTDEHGAVRLALASARAGLHTVRIECPATPSRARFMLELEVFVPDAPASR
jgi:hypothetical protein